MSRPGDRPPVVESTGERPPVVGPDDGSRSVWTNARDVFLAPAATFRDAHADPRVTPPLLLLIATAAFAMTFAMISTGPPDAMRRMLEEAGLPGGAFGVIAITFFAVVSVAIMTPVMAGLVAALLWAWSTLRDGVSRFTVAFVAILYSRLLTPVETVGNSIAMEALDRGVAGATVGPTLVVGPEAVPAVIYGVLLHLNVFSIWVAVLTALAGVHAMALERRDAWGFALALWLLGMVFAVVGVILGGVEPSSGSTGPSL